MIENLEGMIADGNLLAVLLVGATGSVLAAIFLRLLKVMAPSLIPFFVSCFNQLVQYFLRGVVIEQARLMSEMDTNKIVSYYSGQKASMHIYMFFSLSIFLLILDGSFGESLTSNVVLGVLLFVLIVSMMKKFLNVVLPNFIDIGTYKRKYTEFQGDDKESLDSMISELSANENEAGSVFQETLLGEYVEKARLVMARMPVGSRFVLSELFSQADWSLLSRANKIKLGKEFRGMVDSSDITGIGFYGHKGSIAEYRVTRD